jgi:hypothetical protein
MKDALALAMNKEKFVERRIKNGVGITSGMYYGTMESQKKTTDMVKNSKGEKLESMIIASSNKWVDTVPYVECWNKIENLLKKVKNQYERKVNINQFPDDYYDLIDAIRMDITRRRVQEMDFTSEMTKEITNPNFSQSIDLLEFIPFAGVFEEIKGTNDNVPMLEQKTGSRGSVPVTLYGLGHARTLEDELYNLNIYSLQKVNDAVARAHTGLRNNLCLGPLIALSAAAGWNASQQVAADTSGATYDVRLYLTMRNAIRTLFGLLDPQTRQEIDASSVVLLVRNQVIQWDLSRILQGQLQKFGTPVENRESLPINQVWMYKGDIVDVGPKRTTYAGVPADTAYLFVPGPAGSPSWTLNKRQLTQEVGRGDVLQLARERRAWYFGQAQYREEFLGSSSATLGLANGFGWVVEISLPTPDDDT